ncbi:MAG TPA: MBL fold metallo-hydrolase [Deltaproteobacteria bacterium]|jgi:L-ascorbate metabolism protein UlaG (beta-lactamase superfamily)|nr:MBL fold metallo-hydrolase [Deltaproteobacteria bacterium]HQI01288.1 MBL fold metallo-hydrolase [Deltaproteobacteria bacterium]
MVEVRWLGAAGLELSVDDSVVLIDPYLSRPGKLNVLLGSLTPSSEKVRAYISKLDRKVSAVVCSHTHFDHALDIPCIAKELRCRVVGSSSLKTLMEISGAPPGMSVCRGGEVLELDGGIRLHMILSRHGLVFLGRVPYPGEIDPDCEPPLKALEYRHGTVFMPRIEVGGVSIVHAGSANFIESEMEDQRCDILFMCVPGWKKVPNYVSRLTGMLKPEVVVPFHFDDFTSRIPASGNIRAMPLADLGGFVGRVREHAPGTVVLIPNPNEVMRF